MTAYSVFALLNVVDTCSLWNLLASPFLYSAARKAGMSMSSTKFVKYECFDKPGPNSPEWQELRKRLLKCIEAGEVLFCDIELEDLQEVAALEARKAISKGELSSIAWAKRTQQIFFSDDKQAKKLAKAALSESAVQDTPHLCAWLCINDSIHEHDELRIRTELQSLKRPLDPHISNAFRAALEFRLMRDMARQRSRVE